MPKQTPNVVLQWLLPLVVFVVGIGYGLVYYLPNHRERSELAQREQQGQQAHMMNQVMVTTLASDQNRLRLLSQSVEDGAKLLLTEEEVAGLPGQLHKIGEQCGVRVDQLTPSHSFALKSFLQQRYSLRLTGKRFHLISFIYQIESHIPSARIAQFNSNFSQTSQVDSAQMVLEVFADYSEDSN